jgi:lysophospholipase L1-like esterase
MRWLRRLAPNLALALLSALLPLLVAEAGLRLTGYTPEAYRHTERIANGHRTLLLDCYPSNPRGYFPIDLRDPATRARYREQGIARVDEVFPVTPFAVERRYNSLHFRGGEIGPRRPGVRRVAVIGDSFTEGMGVREEDAYPVVLGQLLAGAPGSPLAVEVLNCGRRGYDFPELERLFDQALALEPDVVVLGMVLNDAERSEAFSARQRYVNDWILERGRMYRGAGAPRLSWRDSRLSALIADRLEAYRVGRETTRWYLDMYSEPNRDGWERTKQRIQEMQQRMRERGGELVVAIWPLLVGLDGAYPFRAPAETIAAFCQTAGIRHLDLLPALQGRPDASLWVHPADHHPNQIAHRLVAERLVPVVRAALSD